MTTVEAKNLRGQYCNLTDIVGVNSIKTKGGMDIVTISENLHKTLVKFTELIDDLTSRVHALELSSGPGSSNVPGIQGPKGEKGDRGERGEDGAEGPMGPRGPKIKELREISDVDISNLDDGSILVYRFGKDGRGKWVAETAAE
jgi:hypothetical protein